MTKKRPYPELTDEFADELARTAAEERQRTFDRAATKLGRALARRDREVEQWANRPLEEILPPESAPFETAEDLALRRQFREHEAREAAQRVERRLDETRFERRLRTLEQAYRASGKESLDV